MPKPPPVLSLAIEPTTRADREKLRRSVQLLMAEDPALHLLVDEPAGHVVVAGSGELHLAITVERLKSEFGVQAAVGRPRIVYRERLTRVHAAKSRAVPGQPLMRVEVIVPPERVDDILRDLAARRGSVQSSEARGGRQVIVALVAMADLLGYAVSLRARTDGRGTCTMSFERYQDVDDLPPDRDVAVRQPRRHGPQGTASAAITPES